jgi:hypothetical protein
VYRVGLCPMPTLGDEIAPKMGTRFLSGSKISDPPFHFLLEEGSFFGLDFGFFGGDDYGGGYFVLGFEVE